jgi:non-ribosomal peptide synthetase component F
MHPMCCTFFLQFYRNTVLDFHRLADAFRDYAIDVAFLTTALMTKCLHEAPDVISTLDILAFGGEACHPRDVAAASVLVRSYLGKKGKILMTSSLTLHIAHVYGPTEGTTFSTVWRVPRAQKTLMDVVPIGRPLSNTAAYILDSKQHLVPIGVVGELYLGGDGLARSYGNEQQTAKSFVHVTIEGITQRLYRTGDLVRWGMSDRQMEFIGRADSQVKLRGQRIELG